MSVSAPTGDLIAASRTAAAPRRLRSSRRRRSVRNWLRQNGLFALGLVMSTAVGATATLLVYQPDRPAAPPPPAQTAVLDEALLLRHGRAREACFRNWQAEIARAAGPAQPQIANIAAPPAGSTEADLLKPGIAPPLGRPLAAKSWRYQLQGIDPAAIARSSSDLVVIDYSGSNGPFTRAQVDAMRRKPDGTHRIVLSYLSIGEAEDYRWYWQSRSPAWIGPENPKWPGNYSVRFWHPDWQKIVFEYTDKIIAAGFDGVYLDKVDAYEEMGGKAEMIEFVARISTRAKAQRAGFLVISQNGDDLIGNERFHKAIDGFAREDLFYGEDSDGVRNSADSIQRSIKRLKLITAEGKPVFVVEYPRDDAQAATAMHEIVRHGFVGLLARRSLDSLDR
jgi:cysteinyl-tRNA synthetase